MNNHIRQVAEKSILNELKDKGNKHDIVLKIFTDRLEKLNAELIKPKIVNILQANKIDRLRYEEKELQFEINLFTSVIKSFNLEMDLIEKNLNEIHNLKKISNDYISNIQKELVQIGRAHV